MGMLFFILVSFFFSSQGTVVTEIAKSRVWHTLYILRYTALPQQKEVMTNIFKIHFLT